MIKHLDKALAQGMDYESYRSKVETLFNEGKTTNDDNRDSMLHYTKLNMQRMNKWDKIAKLTEASIDQMQSIANPETWIVLTEGWCGDAAHALPILHKLSEASEKVSKSKRTVFLLIIFLRSCFPVSSSIPNKT